MRAWENDCRHMSAMDNACGICADKRIAELEAALWDCIPFLAVNMDKYRRDFGLKKLHPTHAEIIDRVSRLTGGAPLSAKLAG